jgi:hypothetical protein
MQKNNKCLLWSSVITYMFTFIFMICTFPVNIYSMGGPMPGLENLTPEEMQAIEAQLAEAAQAIDQYVSSLSPEEQEEFHRAVSEVEQMMSTMSEEELNQFFEEVMNSNEMANAPTMPVPPAATTGAPVPAKEEIKIPEKQKFTNEQQQMLTLLTSIVSEIDQFLVKMQNVPIREKIIQWTNQGKLNNIPHGMEWDALRTMIDFFKKDIADMRKSDTKTGGYLFLDALIKQESLYRSLVELDTLLKAEGPNVVVTSFGIDSLSEASKIAIQKILNSFGKIIPAVTPEIKKLFEAYEPEAQKIREEEKKKTERANLESAQQRHPTSALGTARPYGPHQSQFGKQPAGYGGYGDHYGYPQGYGEGHYGPTKATQQPSESRSPASSAPAPAKPKKGLNVAGKKKEEEEKKRKDAEGKEKAEQKGTRAGKKTDAEKEGGKKGTGRPPVAICPSDGGTTPDGILALIKNTVEYTDALFGESAELLANIEKVVIDVTAPLDAQFLMLTIPELTRRSHRLNELLDAYADSIKKSPEAEKMMHDVHAAVQRSSMLKSLFPQLDKLIHTVRSDESFVRTIPADNRYVYFGNMEPWQAYKPALEKPSDAITKKYTKNMLTPLQELCKELAVLHEKVSQPTVQHKAAESEPTDTPA